MSIGEIGVGKLSTADVSSSSVGSWVDVGTTWYGVDWVEAVVEPDSLGYF